MMELWRSEEMQLIQLIIPTDAAHETIAELGDLGLLQFKDLNPDREAFARTYASQVKRCNEMARRLRFFHEQVTGASIPLQSPMLDAGVDLDELESKLEEIEADLTVINENSERLKKTQAELSELQLVLEKAGAFFDEARQSAHGTTSGDSGAASVDAPLLDDVPEAMKATRLGFTAGTIEIENLNAFERLLFRATRGNMYLRYADVGTVTDPNTNKDKQKAVFVVFFAGERAKLKVTKTCEAFSANRYPFPEDTTRQRQMHADVTARLCDLSATIESGMRRRGMVLENIARHLNSWITVVRREKAVYHTMNKLSFDVTRQALVAEAWAPMDARVAIQQGLQRATETSNASVGTVFQPLNTHERPPTYYKTTLFTSCFHGIIEAYGVARYREVNPTPFSLITFPFLFAVMFGDVGHALMMIAFAVVLLAYEKKMLKQKLSDTVDMIFGGRYIIMLMGIFSLYTGFMYNEFFSMPMALFGKTKYKCQEDYLDADGNYPPMVHYRQVVSCTGNTTANLQLNETMSTVYTTGLVQEDVGHPYPFGIDPVWHGTKSELSFLNSVKMKMSIVMGVVHMSLGIFMSLYNHIYFRDRLSFYFEFIPQVIFFWSIFGYLMFVIILKWVDWPRLEIRSHTPDGPDGPGTVSRPPDIYGVMIDMFLKPGQYNDLKYENDMFDGQFTLQLFLVLAALATIPVMLLPKPFILKHRHNKRTVQQGYTSIGGQDADEDNGHDSGGHDDHGEFNFGEIVVHQAIHTIEFVLGAVSNTASYLRLWALSLAHSQLSAVIYDKVLMMVIHQNSVWMMVIGVFVWLIATFLVLMCMESLSAFLHALRLHWVEFMNKFYHGDGILFAPFAFSEVDKDDSFLTM